MKNISVLPVLVTIILSFSAINPVFCEENEERRYAVKAGPQYGFVYGQAIELVYPTNTKGEYLSELLWNMNPVSYFGIQAEFGLINIMSGAGYYISASFKTGTPGDSGIHENRDWMSAANGDLTHYSKHTNKTSEFFMADIYIGASIPVVFFYIKPLINFSLMRFSFSGRDGYGLYANNITDTTYYPIDDNPKKYSYEGMEVIRYEQNWLLLAAGFSLGTNILSPFSLNLSFQISPLTYCRAIDQHLTRKITFYDFTGFGLFLEGGGNVSVRLGLMELSAEFNYRFIGDTRGYTFINSPAHNSSNDSGAGLSLKDTRFIAKMRL